MTQAATDTLTPTVDFAGRPLPPRDIARLKKEPFKTMFDPEQPQTVAALRGFREPNYAYVLFERWRIELVQDGDPVKNYGLFVFSVEDRPDQQPKIEFFIRKGYRILHWGKFHYLDSASEESSKKARMHKNAWTKLEQDLQRLANTTNVIAENRQLKDERDALLAKISEYEAKFAKGKKVEGS